MVNHYEELRQKACENSFIHRHFVHSMSVWHSSTAIKNSEVF